jgi:hypothetical protein
LSARRAHASASSKRPCARRICASEVSASIVLGLTAFGTIPKLSKRVDEAGNAMPFYSWVSRSKGKKVLMVDVFFVGLP